MKLKLTLITLLTSILGFSQEYSFEWGEQIKTTTSITNIYKVNGNSFYALPYGYKNKNKILFYDNLTYKSTTEFENLVNGKSCEYEGTLEIGGSIYTFTSEDNSEKTIKSLYCYKFKESSEELKVEGKKIASFNYDKKNKRRSGFTLITSENKQKLCVAYYSSSRKKSDTDNGNYGYFIFNKDLELENEGGFEDVLEKRGETGIDYQLSNEGTLFLVTELVVKDEPTTINFYKVAQDEINAMELNLKEKYTNQLTIAVDKKENFVVSGFYGENAQKNQLKKPGVRGIFFTVMDPNSQEILNSGFHEFEDDFIMEGLSNRQKEKTEKKKEKKALSQL